MFLDISRFQNKFISSRGWIFIKLHWRSRYLRRWGMQQGKMYSLRWRRSILKGTIYMVQCKRYYTGYRIQYARYYTMYWVQSCLREGAESVSNYWQNETWERERERELHEMFDVSLTAHSGRRPAPRSPRPKLSQLLAGSLSWAVTVNVEHSTVQYTTVQYSKTQYNTVQHRTCSEDSFIVGTVPIEIWSRDLQWGWSS